MKCPFCQVEYVSSFWTAIHILREWEWWWFSWRQSQ